LTLAAAFGLLAGFVAGSSVHATLVESGGIDVVLFSGDASITDPFRGFAAFVYPDSFQFSTSAYANLSADMIQVGFSYVPGLGPPSVGAFTDFYFTFTGLSLLANNRTNNTPFDYREHGRRLRFDPARTVLPRPAVRQQRRLRRLPRTDDDRPRTVHAGPLRRRRVRGPDRVGAPPTPAVPTAAESVEPSPRGALPTVVNTATCW